MPIVELSKIDQIVDDFTVDLDNKLKGQNQVLSDNLAARIPELEQAIKNAQQDAADKLAIVLGDARDALAAMLNGPDTGSIALLSAKLQEAVEAVDKVLGDADNGAIAEFKKVANEYLKAYNLAAQEHIIQFNSALEDRIDQLQKDVMKPSLLHLSDILDNLKRGFVRGTVVLLIIAGLIILSMTLEFGTASAQEYNNVRIALYLIATVFGLILIISNRVLDSFLRIRKRP